MATIKLEIKDCSDCSHCKIGKVYTPDSWDDVQKWHCTKQDKQIFGYHEWNDKSPIPDWCPILIK